MTEAARLLAIDQGGHSTRVRVADDQGGVLAAHAVAVETRLDGDRAEQDAAAVFDSVSVCLERVAERLGHGAPPVAAAGLAVQRASVVCWDRDSGRPLSPVLSWLDRRGAERIAGCGLDPGFVLERTGLHLSPHYGAGKLAWCLDQLPAVQRAAAAGRLGLGPLAAYLAWRLGDGTHYRVDAATAQRTLLWDRYTGDWSPTLCAAFGVPLEALPAVVPCDAGFGTLALGAARVPLAVCAGDQGLILSAYGPADPATISINAGTGAFLLRPLDDAGRAVDPALLRTLAWSGAGNARWAEEGTVNGAASALDRAASGAVPVDAGGGDCPPLFLNGIGGLGSPWWIGDYPSRFLGTPGDGPARERAVIESIVFLLMANVRRMHAGASRVLLTGGLSRHPDLRQWLADALGRPIDVPDDTEATTRGLLAVLSPALARRPPRLRRFEPERGARAGWHARQARWESALLGR